MYFPTAGIETSPLLPPLVALVLSFFTSMGGVSGAFLLLPFQVSVLGFTSPSVSGTNQLYNVIAIPSGVYRYLREGRMVWPLTWVVIAATLPGVLVGAWIRVVYLPDPRYFKAFVGLVLLYIGIRMVRDQLLRRTGSNIAAETRFRELIREHRAHGSRGEALPGVRVNRFSLRHIEYEFYGERYIIPTLGVFFVSLVVGIVGGVYGIGGGAIMAPFFVSIFHLPVYTVAGAALMGTFITSIAGVAFYQAIAPFYPTLNVAPDWSLGILFGLGGMVGIYLGARCQKFFPAGIIKWMLSGIIIFTAGKYFFDFFR